MDEISLCGRLAATPFAQFDCLSKCSNQTCQIWQNWFVSVSALDFPWFLQKNYNIRVFSKFQKCKKVGQKSGSHKRRTFFRSPLRLISTSSNQRSLETTQFFHPSFKMCKIAKIENWHKLQAKRVSKTRCTKELKRNTPWILPILYRPNCEWKMKHFWWISDRVTSQSDRHEGTSVSKGSKMNPE